METYQLFEKVTNNQTSRANSCYAEIDGVVLRIADHQANFTNFSCYNDIENAKAVINVIITKDFLSEKEFESFLDENDLQGEQIIVNDFDGIVDYIQERINYFKN